MPTEISGSTGVNKIQDGTVAVADFASGARGGTTNISKWYAGNWTNSGEVVPIDGTWTNDLYSGLNMSETGGVFTFPETGIWEVYAVVTFYKSDSSALSVESVDIKVQWGNDTDGWSTDGVNGQTHFDSPGNDWWRSQVHATQIIDVTNTSTVKVRFRSHVYGGTALYTAADKAAGGFMFKRLGDT